MGCIPPQLHSSKLSRVQRTWTSALPEFSCQAVIQEPSHKQLTSSSSTEEVGDPGILTGSFLPLGSQLDLMRDSLHLRRSAQVAFPSSLYTIDLYHRTSRHTTTRSATCSATLAARVYLHSAAHNSLKAAVASMPRTLCKLEEACGAYVRVIALIDLHFEGTG
jgi:hypothetical protein